MVQRSAVAEKGNRLVTIDTGRKGGLLSPFRERGKGELGPIIIQCGLGRGLYPYQVAASSIQPFGHNRHGPKIGGFAPHFWGRVALGPQSPSNTMWPGTRPTSMPSGMLIHPAVWPQYTNVTDRQEKQTDRITI